MYGLSFIRFPYFVLGLDSIERVHCRNSVQLPLAGSQDGCVPFAYHLPGRLLYISKTCENRVNWSADERHSLDIISDTANA